MQMHLAQVMEGTEPPSEYVVDGTETHPAAGRLFSVDPLSALLFHLCWMPSHCVTVLPGCGNRGGRRGAPKQRLIWKMFFQIINFNLKN